MDTNQGNIGSLLRRLLRGTFWSTAATGIVSAFNLLGGIVCARVLEAKVFGQLGILQSTVGFVSLLAGLGLGTTATRFVARYLASDPAKCGRMLGGVMLIGVGTISAASVALLIGARPVAVWLQTPELESAVRICAGWVAAMAASEMLMAILAGFESFRTMAGQSLLRGCFIFAGMVSGLKWGLGGSLIGWTLGLLASCVLLVRVLRDKCRAHHLTVTKPSADEARALLRYAVPTLVASLSYAPFVWIANATLVKYPGGFEQLAMLTVAYQWRGLFTYLPVSLSRVALPLLSASDSSSSDHGHRAFAVGNLLNQYAVWGVGIALLGAAGMVLGFYGDEFLQGRWIFLLVLGGAMVGYVGNSLGSLIQARELFRLGIGGNLLSGISLAGCTFMLGERLGAAAVGVGAMVGYLLNLTVCAWVLSKTGEIKVDLGWRVFASGIVAAVCTLVIAGVSPLQAAFLAGLLLPLAMVAIHLVFAKPEGISLLHFRLARSAVS